MEKYTLIVLIIALAGTFGGTVRFLNSSDLSKPINWKEVLKYILTGIGSAILIPLFLNMLSSDLIKGDEIPILNYFIFTGFCFIAAFLSEKFISSIGERVLSEVKQVKKDQKEDKKTLDALIDDDSEPEEGVEEKKGELDNALTKLSTKIGSKQEPFMMEVLKTFRGDRYKFRSVKGISKELDYPENTVKIIIKTFENNGLIRGVRRRRDGKILWGITSLGKFMRNKEETGA